MTTERGRGDRDSRPKTAAPITGGNYMAPGFGPPSVPMPHAPAFLQDGGQAFNKANREAAGQGVLGYPASAKLTLTFSAPGTLPTWSGPTTGVTSRAVWQSPLIDLRADLQNQFGAKGNTTPMQREVLEGYRYVMQVQTTWAYNSFMRVYYVEFGHVNNPQLASQYIDRIDITSAWWAGSLSSGNAIMSFAPEGILRYYAVAVIFDNVSGGAINTPLTIASAMS